MKTEVFNVFNMVTCDRGRGGGKGNSQWRPGIYIYMFVFIVVASVGRVFNIYDRA